MFVTLRRQVYPNAIAMTHTQRWQELSEAYLPVTLPESIWRYSRPHKVGDIRQGWKVHIAATILSASEILAAVAPYLKKHDVLFKAPVSLDELQRLNSGEQYGYCQVGKFITVYARSTTEAKLLVQESHRLTRGLPAPSVPFDCRFRADSCVFYRYGAFESLEVPSSHGAAVPALRAQNGELIPDERYSATGKPDWVPPLFPNKSFRIRATNSLLKTTYRAFESLAQRGKGGVYKAFDFSVSPPRLCLLKEGRHCGETSWDGHDGAWLVRHEEKVLRSLAHAGIPVPRVFRSFRLNRNQYLITEFVDENTLDKLLSRRQRRLRVDRAVAYAVQLASLIIRIHDAGWAWRDCKPANLIVTKGDMLRPIDFEGSSPIDALEFRVWSTKGFTPLNSIAASGRLADLYAVGAVTYFMLTGELPVSPIPVSLEKLRGNVPEQLWGLVRKLLSPDAGFTAREVWQQLSAVTI